MKKNSKRNHSSRVSDLELNSTDAEKEKKERQNNFVELLPPEVTFKIFSQLDIWSLCRASVTCRSWNHTIRHSDALWKPHCLTVRAVCQREIDDDLESGYPWRVSLTYGVCSVLDNMVVSLSPSLPSAWKREDFISRMTYRVCWRWELKLNFIILFLQTTVSPIHLFTFWGHLPLLTTIATSFHSTLSKTPRRLCESLCSVHTHTHLLVYVYIDVNNLFSPLNQLL